MQSDPALDAALEWLRRFEAEHGHPLRVLHLGNIANNAYLNAKFLRRVGVEADVVCAHYYHVMGCPEWEDVELVHGHDDDFDPHFKRSDLRCYRRPDWFIQGPPPVCAARVAWRWRRQRTPWDRLVNPLLRFADRRPAGKRRQLMQLALLRPRDIGLTLLAKMHRIDSWSHFIYLLMAEAVRKVAPERLHPTLRQLRDRLRSRRSPSQPPPGEGKGFELAPADLKWYAEIFRHYDLVQAYGSMPMYLPAAASGPYVAFEHGTLRDFTTEDDPLHRLITAGYVGAQHTFVTNGDCLAHAQRLKLKSFSAMVHPVDVDQHRADHQPQVEKLRDRFGARVLLLCPLRHDWAVKGTDVHLRALPLIRSAVDGKVILLTANWGMQIEDSRRLIAELGCSENVIWLPSMPRATMIKLIQAADVVLDQIALPHFGATAPQALAAGTPVISSYVPESTSWIVPEPAPILPAFSPEDVSAAVLKALDPEWRRGFLVRAREWIDRYHSPNRVIRDHLTVYREVLEGEQRS